MRAGWGVALCYRTLSNEIQNHWLICIPPFPHKQPSLRIGPEQSRARSGEAYPCRREPIWNHPRRGERGPAGRCQSSLKKGTSSLHFIGPFPFFQRPSWGAVSEPSRRDKYRR